MGAFTDLFKKDGKRDTTSVKGPIRHDTEVKTAAHGFDTSLQMATTSPRRPCNGPRPISERSDSTASWNYLTGSNAAARGSIEGARIGVLLQKKRPQSAAIMEPVSNRMSQVNLRDNQPPPTPPKRRHECGSGHGPLPLPPSVTTPTRPHSWNRTQSSPGYLTDAGNAYRPPILHAQSHQSPLSIEKQHRGSHLPPLPFCAPSSPSKKANLYPQALPVAPRTGPPPLPPTRRPPVRQAVPSAPPLMPVSTRNSPTSTYSPLFPGAFPRSRDVSISTIALTDTTVPSCSEPSGLRVEQQPGQIPTIGYAPETSLSHVAPPQYSPSPRMRPSPPVPVATRPLSPAGSPQGLTSNIFNTMTQASPRVLDLTDDANSISSLPYRNSPALSTPTRTPPLASTSPGPIRGTSPRKHRCHGTTGAGKRCTRAVGAISSTNSSPASSPSKSVPKVDAATTAGGTTAYDSYIEQAESMLEDDDGGGGGIVRFCFQHAKQVMSERGCFVDTKAGGRWVEFDGEFGVRDA